MQNSLAHAIICILNGKVSSLHKATGHELFRKWISWKFGFLHLHFLREVSLEGSCSKTFWPKTYFR